MKNGYIWQVRYLKIFLFSLTVLTSFSSTRIVAQRHSVLYYNSDWRLTLKEFAKYYRVGIMDTSKCTFYGLVKDFFRNGQLQMQGMYADNIKVDTFYFFYEDGQLQAKGRYVNNLRNGEWKYYYSNGQLKQTVIFQPYDFTVVGYYDSLGKPLMTDGSGKWENTYTMLQDKMRVRIEGKWKEYQKHGLWTTYSQIQNDIERVDHQDNFKMGLLITSWYSGTYNSAYLPDYPKFKPTEKCWASVYASQQSYPFIKKLPEYVDSLKLPYDKNAEFMGGQPKLDIYLKNILHYPVNAKRQNLKSLVLINFLIDEKGLVSDVLVEWKGDKIYEEDLHQKIQQAFEKSPPWIPAQRNEKNVKQRQQLFIVFGKNKASDRSRKDFSLIEGIPFFLID